MNEIMFGLLGMWETIAILAVVLVLFGAKKVPELAKGLGQGIKEFKKASRDMQDEVQRAWEAEPPPAPPAPKNLPPADKPEVAKTDDGGKAA
ncbi:MAG: twin-arginine translocase TatA/TatE family subunit [Verrucomicrobiota bacterium]